MSISVSRMCTNSSMVKFLANAKASSEMNISTLSRFLFTQEQGDPVTQNQDTNQYWSESIFV